MLPTANAAPAQVPAPADDTVQSQSDAYAEMLDELQAAQATEAQLVRTIKALVEKGSNKAQAKAEQFYIAAGQHIKTLKALHDGRGGTWAGWEAYIKEKCGIGKSRASELMLIADGRKTVADVRADTAQRVMKHAKSSPLANGETLPTKVKAAPVDEQKIRGPDPGPIRAALANLKRAEEEIAAGEEEIAIGLAELGALSAEDREHVLDSLPEDLCSHVEDVGFEVLLLEEAWQSASKVARLVFVAKDSVSETIAELGVRFEPRTEQKADVKTVPSDVGAGAEPTKAAPVLGTATDKNAGNPEASADAMKAQFAKLDDGEIESEIEPDEAVDVLALVEEVLDGAPLTEKQAAIFEKVKKRLKRWKREAAKQEAQLEEMVREHKADIGLFVARLVAAGLARDLWLALTLRGPCGFRELYATWLVRPLVDALEEALAKESSAVSSTKMVDDDGLDIPDFLRRPLPAANGRVS